MNESRGWTIISKLWDAHPTQFLKQIRRSEAADNFGERGGLGRGEKRKEKRSVIYFHIGI